MSLHLDPIEAKFTNCWLRLSKTSIQDLLFVESSLEILRLCRSSFLINQKCQTKIYYYFQCRLNKIDYMNFQNSKLARLFKTFLQSKVEILGFYGFSHKKFSSLNPTLKFYSHVALVFLCT